MQRPKRPAPPPIELSRVAIALPPSGALRVVVISDTHGRPHPDAARRVADARPDHVLHAGDVGEVACLGAFAAIAPLTVVRGNIDPRGLPDAVGIDVRDDERSLLGVLLVHYAVQGPKLRADAARLAADVSAQIVVCGHSHVPFLGRDRGLAIMNPGSIGPRRFGLPIVFGVLEIGRERVTMHHVDCETGERWSP